MPNKDGVKEAISLIDNPEAIPSGRGDDPSKATEDNRTKEQVMAENKRKAEEITEWREKYEEAVSRIDDISNEIEKLKNVKNPSQHQLNTIDNLEVEKDKLADEVERRPDAQGWIRTSERTATKIAKNEVAELRKEIENREVIRGNSYLEQESKKLKIPIKELIKNLNPYAERYQELYPLERNQRAFEDWQEQEKKSANLTLREKKVQEEEMRIQFIREGRGRIPIEKEKEDAYFNATDKRGRTRAVIDMIGTQSIITSAR